jgi:hypothetical protein
MRRATAIAFLSGVLTNQGVVGGWIDEDTPAEKRLTTSFIDGSEYKLVCDAPLRIYIHPFQKIRNSFLSFFL